MNKDQIKKRLTQLKGLWDVREVEIIDWLNSSEPYKKVRFVFNECDYIAEKMDYYKKIIVDTKGDDAKLKYNVCGDHPLRGESKSYM